MIKRTSILKRIFVGFICVATLTISFFGVTNSASARAVFQAGTTRYVASTGTDSGTCTSAAAPCRTIQYAVNQSGSGGRILVAQGTYTYNATTDPCPFIQTRAVVCFVDKSLSILGGYSTSNWSTANPAGNPTIISGQSSRRGVAILGLSTTITNLDMEGFTIQNGLAQGPTYVNPIYEPSGIGGGMWVFKAAVTLRDMVFKNNQAVGANTASGAGGGADGGALRIESSPVGTSSLLQRVTFDGNQSLGGVGPIRGGVAFGAVYVFGSIVTVEDSTFTNNLAQGGNSTGNGTTADGLAAHAHGGGFALGNGTAVLNRIVATNNQVIGGNAATNAGGGFGGAIYSENASAIVINDSFISGNTVQAGNAATGGFGAGGGILVLNSPATVERVKLISNSAIGGNTTGGGNAGPAGGGGLYLWNSPPASVKNAIIADNYAAQGSVGGAGLGGGGGGIQVQGMTATITHTTIAQNRLGPTLISGQGLLALHAPGESAATVNINNSIVANHTQGGSGAFAVLAQAGNSINFSRGLFAGNTTNTSGPVNGLGNVISASSAGFISQGSPNYNYHLRLDSAAKDQATNGLASEDIDLQSRPFNSISDLGADEYWPFPLSAFPADSTLHLNWSAGVGVLTGGVSKYEVVVTCPAGANPPDQGNCGQPINAGTSTTLTLTGLTNLKQYTIVVNARNSSQTLIATSTTAVGFPNNVADGTDTTGVFRPSNGLLYLKNSNDTGFADAALNYGLPGDYPVVGDWDGNGTVTIGIYRNGSFFLRNSNTLGFAEMVFPFGNPGDQPIAGDWDGDGVDTIGIYRPSNGQFLLRNSNDAGPAEASFFLGNAGDVGVAGDWNGDGLDTTGVFRPSNGVIFLKDTNDTGFADYALNYGLPGDQPVIGDWNNDGVDTIGIYRNGTFFLRNENTNGFAELIFGLGNPGDMPIAGNWDGSNP
jgi:hypothetical protein